VTIACGAVTAAQAPPQSSLSALLTRLGLSSQQRADLEAGRPVAKVLSWGESSEIYVFGAVRMQASSTDYLRAARNVARLSGTPGYLGVGEIAPSATTADLAGLTIDPDDIKALKSCREGDCDVQLPSASIQAFRDAVDWSKPDVANQVNALARRRILGLIQEYRKGGNKALGVYRDKDDPALVAQQFEKMVGRAAELPNVLPELRQYLLNYPNADLPEGDSFFYWENVDFGMKPTLRVNHGVIYRAADRGISVVAIKQLYASHYFHTALDVSVCVEDASKPSATGFYLLTLKGSEQDGLTGLKGSIVRKVVVDKTRSGLEKALGALKASLEKPQAAAAR
jgi:hypothetical protein